MELIQLTTYGSEVPVLINPSAIAALKHNTSSNGTNIYLMGQASHEHPAFHVVETPEFVQQLLKSSN